MIFTYRFKSHQLGTWEVDQLVGKVAAIEAYSPEF